MTNPPRIMVTGAKGLIGRAVCEKLHARGDRVVAIDVDKIDLRRDDNLGQYTPVDAIIHLAGVRLPVAQQRTKGATLMRDNLRIDLNVLGWAERAGIPGVYASTVSVYEGAGSGFDPRACSTFRESDATRFPDPSVRYSAWAKLTTERYLEALNEESGLPWSVARLANVYGPGDRFDETSLIVPALIHRALTTTGPLRVGGDGTPVRDVLYVDDAADGILAALDARPRDTFNLGSGAGYTVRDIAIAVLHAVGTPDREISFQFGAQGAARKVLDVTKARDVLHWTPKVGLEEGIAHTVAWFHNAKQETPK